MSFTIDQGLFNLEFTDYHAILGVPVDAEGKDIRKRYLQIARRLHPDSCASESEADRRQAAEFLSKLVNPAYEKLSNERDYIEYCLLLRLKGQQALRQQETVLLTSEPARKLAAASDVEHAYTAALSALAESQYQKFDRILEITGQISELNLVYLMRRESKSEPGARPLAKPAGATGTPSSAPASAPAGAANHAANAAAARRPASRDAMVEGYMRRSQELENKRDFAKAILELREALQIDPKNSNCHSRLGSIYLKTNQLTMAKIHFNKALELNPQDQVALAATQKLAQPNAGQGATAKKPDPKADKPDKSGGGLFGLFGGKKK